METKTLTNTATKNKETIRISGSEAIVKCLIEEGVMSCHDRLPRLMRTLGNKNSTIREKFTTNLIVPKFYYKNHGEMKESTYRTRIFFLIHMA